MSKEQQKALDFHLNKALEENKKENPSDTVVQNQVLAAYTITNNNRNNYHDMCRHHNMESVLW